MTPGFEREPCFWTVSNAQQTGYNNPDRQRETIVEGKRVLEKFPQRGHLGDYEDRRQAPGVRALRVVRHDGFVIDAVVTTAAACLDPDTEYGKYVRRKMAHLGWFGIGACPVALLHTGHLVRDHIVDRSLLDQQPCSHGTYSPQQPCVHARAERDARLAQHTAKERDRLAGLKDQTDKLIEAQREIQHEQTKALLEASRGGTEALVALVTQLLAGRPDALAQLAAAAPLPQPPAPPAQPLPAPAPSSPADSPKGKGK